MSDIYDRRLEAERVRNALIRRGLEEGREVGREEGRVEGRAEGIAIGRSSAVSETARRMKVLGLSLETIAVATGMPEPEIARL